LSVKIALIAEGGGNEEYHLPVLLDVGGVVVGWRIIFDPFELYYYCTFFWIANLTRFYLVKKRLIAKRLSVVYRPFQKRFYKLWPDVGLMGGNWFRF